MSKLSKIEYFRSFSLQEVSLKAPPLRCQEETGPKYDCYLSIKFRNRIKIVVFVMFYYEINEFMFEIMVFGLFCISSFRLRSAWLTGFLTMKIRLIFHWTSSLHFICILKNFISNIFSVQKCTFAETWRNEFFNRCVPVCKHTYAMFSYLHNVEFSYIFFLSQVNNN